MKSYDNHILMSVFGEWLKRKRDELRISGGDLERRSGVSRQYISNLERNVVSQTTGKPIQPSLEKVDALARALGVDIGEARLAAGYAPVNRADAHNLDGIHVEFGTDAPFTDEEKTELLNVMRVFSEGIRSRKKS